jgi:hypothetical protein
MRLLAPHTAPKEAEPYAGQRWEYQAVQIRKSTGDFQKLNAFGQQGWELVCFDPSMVAWFKRPAGGNFNEVGTTS